MISLLEFCVLACAASHAQATVEQAAYRLQQFELHGIARGSKGSSLNGEAITWQTLSTLKTGAGSVALLRWWEVDFIQDAVAKGVSGVIVVLPGGEDASTDVHMEPEQYLLRESISVAVYLVNWTPEIQEAFSRGQRSSKALDFDRLWSGTIKQFSVSATAPKAITRLRLPTLYGTLQGTGTEEERQTIAVVAHYDSFAASPELAFGVDSNGSGVAVLLELLRIFSTLFSVGKTAPKANIMFILSAGGKFNYQGIKRLIEDAVESQTGDQILVDSKFAICLDSVGSAPKLYAHVSKPPKAGHAMRTFFDHLNRTQDVEVVHKKINLADDMRYWEHERFSLNKLSAFTLSSHSSSVPQKRNSLFDRRVDLAAIESNVNRIALAIASFIYKQPVEVTEHLFEGSLGADREHLKAVIDFMSRTPRSIQLVHSQNSVVVKTLQKMMSQHLPKDALKFSFFTPDKREPELVLYDQTQASLQISEVKPVLFDLVLAAIIAVYLCIAFLVIGKFGSVVRSLTPTDRKDL